MPAAAGVVGATGCGGGGGPRVLTAHDTGGARQLVGGGKRRSEKDALALAGEKFLAPSALHLPVATAILITFACGGIKQVELRAPFLLPFASGCS